MKVIVQTTAKFPGRTPREVWELMCGCHFPKSANPMFKLGVPEPIECRLPEGRGVGKTRECVLSTGTVQQKILAWEEPSRLVVQADNPEAVKWYASQIKDTFTLDGFSGSGNNCFAFFFSLFNTCTITRRSEIEARGPIRAAMVWIGMKFVHMHVFRNWKKMLKS